MLLKVHDCSFDEYLLIDPTSLNQIDPDQALTYYCLDEGQNLNFMSENGKSNTAYISIEFNPC